MSIMIIREEPGLYNSTFEIVQFVYLRALDGQYRFL
jgi:hypothetical protein